MPQLGRKDMLLVFVGASAKAVGPVRIMKGLFLFSQESAAALELKYEFVPYSYGPCSFQIYDDLRELVSEHLVEKRPTSARWSEYVVTVEGKEIVDAIASRRPELFADLSRYNKMVTSRTFAELLRSVYSKYPDYAVKSVFKG